MSLLELVGTSAKDVSLKFLHIQPSLKETVELF